MLDRFDPHTAPLWFSHTDTSGSVFSRHHEVRFPLMIIPSTLPSTLSLPSAGTPRLNFDMISIFRINTLVHRLRLGLLEGGQSVVDDDPLYLPSPDTSGNNLAAPRFPYTPSFAPTHFRRLHKYTGSHSWLCLGDPLSVSPLQLCQLSRVCPLGCA